MNTRFMRGLARAVGGAIVFSLPLWMTMEMWWLGFSMDPWRLILLIVLNIPLLILLSYFSGFEDTVSRREDVVDAFVALAVAITTSTLILLLVEAISFDITLREITGKIAVQTVPASIGAMLAQSILGQHPEERKRRQITYWSGLFLMGVGALFVSWNVAPTEEVVKIALAITSVHGIGMVILSLLIIHAFMFALEFRGEPDIPENMTFMSLFLRETVVGYAIALLLSGYVLWSFGRLDGLALVPAVHGAVVLALPAAIGAAAARLIL